MLSIEEILAASSPPHTPPTSPAQPYVPLYSNKATGTEIDSPVAETSSPSSSPAPSSRVSKRPGEDILLYAVLLARSRKYKPTSEEKLVASAKMSLEQQLLHLSADMIDLIELVDVAVAKPTSLAEQWSVSTALSAAIYAQATFIILSPSLGAYVVKRVPIKILSEYLVFKGIVPKSISEDPAKWTLVTKTMETAFTNQRYDLKALASFLIAASVGTVAEDNSAGLRIGATNIVTLCATVVGAFCDHSVKISVTIELCARVAFLRFVFLQNSGSRYWHIADKELAALRLKHAGNAQAISKAFKKILDKDRVVFGSATLPSITVQPTVLQAEADKASSESQSTAGVAPVDDQSAVNV